MSDENPTVEDQSQVSTVEAVVPVSDEASQLAAVRAELEAERARIAELTPLADKARELEEANKTELEKLQEARAQLEVDKASLAEENVRLRLAQVYGLAEEDLVLLGSGPAEQMEANAKRVQELRAAAVIEAVPSERPVDSLKPGSSAKQALHDVSYPSHWAV